MRTEASADRHRSRTRRRFPFLMLAVVTATKRRSRENASAFRCLRLIITVSQGYSGQLVKYGRLRSRGSINLILEGGCCHATIVTHELSAWAMDEGRLADSDQREQALSPQPL